MTFVSLAPGSYRGTASSGAVRANEEPGFSRWQEFFAVANTGRRLFTARDERRGTWVCSGKCGACCLPLVPKKGLTPSHFGNSFRLKEIAASTEYNKVSFFQSFQRIKRIIRLIRFSPTNGHQGCRPSARSRTPPPIATRESNDARV
jgi:hypothetical protein